MTYAVGMRTGREAACATQLDGNVSTDIDLIATTTPQTMTMTNGGSLGITEIGY